MLIRHTLLYMPAQIIGPLAQFAAILVFTHWMAPGPYGVLTYVMASQDFVFLLCLSWFSQYTIRYFSSHEAGSDDHYRESEFTILLATVIPQIAAAMLALRLISVELSPWLVTATVLYTVTRCLSLHLGERSRAQSRILDYTLATSAGPLAGFALAFAAVSRVAATPEAALIGYGIAQAIVLVWLMTRQHMRLVVAKPDPELLRLGARLRPAADPRRRRRVVRDERDPHPRRPRAGAGRHGPHRCRLGTGGSASPPPPRCS